MTKYAVTTIEDGKQIDVICNDADEFIDVCEALGENVISVVSWESVNGARVNVRNVEIDWL